MTLAGLYGAAHTSCLQEVEADDRHQSADWAHQFVRLSSRARKGWSATPRHRRRRARHELTAMTTSRVTRSNRPRGPMSHRTVDGSFIDATDVPRRIGVDPRR